MTDRTRFLQYFIQGLRHIIILYYCDPDFCGRGEGIFNIVIAEFS